MKTIVIIGGIILAGATTIAVMMNDRNEAAQPVIQSQGIPPMPDSNAVSPKLNPAHGLPGHRCDLAVGAPLSSTSEAPAPAAAPPTINMNSAQQPQPQQAAPAGLKVNPAHGQPGHRCDLQVGAPL